ncbi:MAG: hypothetical protein NVSMB64_23910 [Candidatus Velthaea sp.]
MIRVSVPIDVNAVASNASAAFALATPLRVEDMVVLAVVQSLGPRAPQDKRERIVRRTLDGLCEGRFIVEIDGRHYYDPHAVVVCAGVVNLRFFSRRSFPRAA